MGTISTEAPKTMTAAIIPSKGSLLVNSSFLVNRRRMVPMRMATKNPEAQSQTGNTPSGKCIWDIESSLKNNA
jgi:hypothetical protein